MNTPYGGLNPLDGQRYWKTLQVDPGPIKVLRPDQDVIWKNIDGTLYPMAGTAAEPGAPREEEQDLALMRAIMRAQRHGEFQERQRKIIADLEAGAQAVEAYGPGGLVPLSALGVDGTTGARAAGMNPAGMALPVTPDAWRVRPMPSGQPQSPPAAAPTATAGNLSGLLSPAGANRFTYQPPPWAGGK